MNLRKTLGATVVVLAGIAAVAYVTGLVHRHHQSA